MATIQSQLRLNDGMSTVLRQVTAALDMCLASYEQMQATSRQAMDIGGITAARVGLSEANVVIDDMAAGLRQVENQQNGVNRTARAGTSAFDGMLGKIGQMAAAYLSIQGMQKVMNLSDSITSTQARLSFIVDDGGSVANLEAQIFASAQRSRAAYLDTASAVASLSANAGNAFAGNSEVIAFMEQINKQFVIGGASAQGQSAAMLQLTQAMAAGALRGEELNSILENAPGIARSIEGYMGWAEGSIKQYAQEGAVTADIVKNAILSVADETNAMFAEMPMTWAQVWTGMGNVALRVFNPLLIAIGWIANNLDILGPLILGVGVAFLVFQIAAHWTQIAAFATAAYHAVVGFLSIGFGVLTGSTAAASAAVFTFNSALLASPITWIIILIVVLIGVIYAVVAAVNKFAGTSVSATGIIFGVLYTLWAHLFNTVVVPWWNGFAALSNFIGNLFNDPVAAIKVLFLDMAQTVIGYILNMASAIESLVNKIPGVQVNITAGLDSFYNQLEAASQKVKDESGWVEYVGKLDFMDYGQAWNTGYSAGQGVESNISDMFNPNGSLLDGMGNNLSDIANNTGSTAASVKTMSEDLVYLRDIAEREAINRFTTSEIKVDMTGMTNRIDSSMDVDGVLSQFTDGVREALVTSAEGVHK